MDVPGGRRFAESLVSGHGRQIVESAATMERRQVGAERWSHLGEELCNELSQHCVISCHCPPLTVLRQVLMADVGVRVDERGRMIPAVAAHGPGGVGRGAAHERGRVEAGRLVTTQRRRRHLELAQEARRRHAGRLLARWRRTAARRVRLRDGRVANLNEHIS
jgi:hypothetical protein